MRYEKDAELIRFLRENTGLIISTFNKSGTRNLRILKHALNDFKKIFEMVNKYYPNTNSTPISDSAESILEVLNVITLIFGIAAGFICFIIGVIGQYGSSYLIISGICIAIISIISWAALKVILNISNNLHQINSKLK